MQYNRNIVILVALCVGLLVIFATRKGCRNQKFNWRETYAQDSREPYGGYVFYELIKKRFPAFEFYEIESQLTDNLPWDTLADTPASYIFVGLAIYMDSTDTQSLLHFVEKGNTAFISSKTIPFDLMFYLYYEECDYYYWNDYESWRDSVATLQLLHPMLQTNDSLQLTFNFKHKTDLYNWSYISPEAFCDEVYNLVKLGTMNEEYPNFAKVAYGDGVVYLHTTPLVLSNYFLLSEASVAYAEKLISHLPPGDIYYDNYSRVSEGVGRRRNQNNTNNTAQNRTFNAENELSYILSQPPLAWAWYLGLTLAILYLIFRAKRRQRIIPVLEKNRNTSLEFVSTIGRLYFLQNNHRKLGLQKFRLWKAYIHNKYFLNGHRLDDAFVKKLSTRSNVPESLIRDIINRAAVVERATNIQEHQLVNFHQRLEEFYRLAR